MRDLALKMVQSFGDDAHLALFAQRLLGFLVTDLNEGAGASPFTQSRAKALLRVAAVVDDPTLHDFERLVVSPAGTRIALFTLLDSAKLSGNDEIQALAAVSTQSPISEPQSPIEWLALAVAAFAWQKEYPLYQLDPASPPATHSPAGQILKRAGYFMRQQVQRGATERDKLAKKLAFRPGQQHTPTLATMPQEQPVAPVPPHFRMPIPVNYPEVANETLQVDTLDVPRDTPTMTPSNPSPVRGQPIVITEADLPSEPTLVRQPAISISTAEVQAPAPPRPLPPSGVILPAPSRAVNSQSRPGLTMGFRNAFRAEEMKTTKLRVIVQQYPDGPGVYGLQIKVSCKGIRSFVAGTTSREGHFVAELPVRMSEGLTYDVDVTWPRDAGGETERKSITLNADRTQFTLPFYRRLQTN